MNIYITQKNGILSGYRSLSKLSKATGLNYNVLAYCFSRKKESFFQQGDLMVTKLKIE